MCGGKYGNQEDEVRREEKESDKAGDVEEEIPLEALGGLATDESKSQN